jgi:hypothetical protein
VVSGAPKGNVTARNMFRPSTDYEVKPKNQSKVSVSKLNEILGQNIVQHCHTPAATEYFQYTNLPQKAPKKPEVYESPVKQARINGIHHSGNMRESLSYNDNDCSHGIVTTKQEAKHLFGGNALKKEVWKPKTTLQWHEGYRAPLTLQ